MIIFDLDKAIRKAQELSNETDKNIPISVMQIGYHIGRDNPDPAKHIAPLAVVRGDEVQFFWTRKRKQPVWINQ